RILPGYRRSAEARATCFRAGNKQPTVLLHDAATGRASLAQALLPARKGPLPSRREPFLDWALRATEYSLPKARKNRCERREEWPRAPCRARAKSGARGTNAASRPTEC